MTRFQWDEAKDDLLCKDKARGGIGFREVLNLYRGMYYEELNPSDYDQLISIGWVGERLYTLVFEFRFDELGEYRHLVTFWKSTKKEVNLYVENTK
jgi:uncharacterized DUF497 family protein